MKIQIEKQIEVLNSRTHEGLSAIIEHALKAKSVSEMKQAIQTDERIQEIDFFIIYFGSHVAVHEVLPNGENSERLYSERLLFIHL